MQDFKQLNVWKDAIDFCAEVYTVTKNFPREELYGLTSQLRRASSSIGANIAEGAGRSTQKNFRQFLFQAMGSVKECENFLILSHKLKYLSDEDLENLDNKLTSVAKQLNKLIQSIKID